MSTWIERGSPALTLTAGEAALITGVPASTVADWRRRGLLPAGDGRWTRHTFRTLLHLSVTSALIDAGISAGEAIKHAHDIVQELAFTVLSGLKPRTEMDYSIAVVGRCQSGDFYKYVAQSVRHLMEVKQDPGSFKSFTVIMLGAIIFDIYRKIELMVSADEGKPEEVKP